MILGIEITETEFKAMQYIALSVQEWTSNAVTERARVALDDIVDLTVKKCLELGIQIPSSKEAMVDLAYEQEWIKTAEQRNAEVSELGEYNGI